MIGYADGTERADVSIKAWLGETKVWGKPSIQSLILPTMDSCFFENQSELTGL